MTQSFWKLTLDPSGTPLVILNIGDLLDNELKFTLQKGMEVINLEDSSAPFLRSRRNAVYQIEFERRILAASVEDARSEVLGWPISLSDYGKKPLKCEFSGENDYWTFANAFITSATTHYKIGNRDPALMLNVSITAASLTRTVV
jgi:hypothetical protein